MNKILWFVVTLPILLYVMSCGRGGGGLPPDRPSSEISGHAVDALIVNGSLAVYNYENGEKGELLGTTITDEFGAYTLSLKSKDRPVLLEITGGYYTEEASGKRVILNDGQLLQAVTFYVSGQSLKVMVTPFTNLAAGLVAYKVSQGVNVNVAITESTSAITSFLALDILGTYPRNITDPNNVTNIMTDEHRYGFFTAGFSSWTSWASEENNVGIHTVYTSIALAQLMYQDIHSDGKLDGEIIDDGVSNSLSFGAVSLTANVYRSDLARHIIALADSPENKTGLGVDDVLDLATDLSQATHAIFGGLEPQLVDITSPTIAMLEVEGLYKGGVFTFAVSVSDFVGVASVTFDLDGAELGIASLPENPTIDIDSREYADGEHLIGVRAIDNVGNTSYQQFTVKFDNTNPFFNVTSALVVDTEEYVLSGTYVDQGVGLEAIYVNDVLASKNTDGTWLHNVVLASGVNVLLIRLVDRVGNIFETEVKVALDVANPIVKLNYSSATLIVDDAEFTGSLGDLDINENAKLRYNYENLSLLGIEFNRLAFDANNIAYLAVTAEDPFVFGVSTPLDKLSLQYSYSVNGINRFDFREITQSTGYSDGGVYLIPLTIESLAQDWFQFTEESVHSLAIKVTDLAGNVTLQSFSFRVRFDLQDITVISKQRNATANLYAFEDGVKGGLIGSCSTDNTGQCTYGLYTDAKPILVEVMGGLYLEAASDISVDLAANEGYRSIVLFEAEDIYAIVTPLTHIATGYFENLIESRTFFEAYSTAAASFKNTYDFDVFTTIPLDLNDPSSISSILTIEHKYGFQLAALSEYSAWANVENGLPPHTQYTTYTLSEMMRDDILLDGQLDGLGAEGVLALGTLVLNDNEYRFGIGLKLLDYAKGERNVSGFDALGVFDYANRVAKRKVDIYGDKPGYDLDASGPRISLPLADTWQRGAIELLPIVSDDGGVASIYFDIDGKILGDAADVDVPIYRLDTNEYSDGSYTLGITAIDDVGNTSYRQFNLHFDNMAPIFSVTSPDSTGNSSFLVTGTSNDVGVGVQDIKVNGTSATINDNGTWSAQVSLTQEGNNSLAIVVTDSVGNFTNGNIAVVLDTSLPIFTITSPSQTKNAMFTVTGTVSSGGSNAVSIDSLVVGGSVATLNDDGAWSANVTLLEEGVNRLDIVVLDSVGNRATGEIDILLDTFSPTIIVTSIRMSANPSFTISGTSNDLGGSGVQHLVVGGVIGLIQANGDWSANVGLAQEGNNSLLIVVTDAVGNVTTDNVSVLLDRIAPVIDVTSAAMTIDRSFTITGTSSDVGAGIENLLIGGKAANLNDDGSWSVNFTLINEGMNNLSLSVTDRVGNVKNGSTAVLLDITAPSISVTSSDQSGDPSFMVTGTLRDIGAGIERITVDGVIADIKADDTWSVSVVLNQEGRNTLSIIAIDGVGNVANSLTDIVLDTTAPTYTVTSLAISGRSSFTVTGTLDDNTGTGIQSLMIAGSRATINDNGTWSANVELSQEGLNNLSVRIIDAVGNIMSSTVIVTLDTRNPVFTLASSEISDSNVYTMSGTVSDASAGIKSLTIGGQIIEVVAGAWQFSTPLENEGDNNFGVLVIDNVGNTLNDTVNILRDTIPPTINHTSAKQVATNSTTIRGEYTETGAGIAEITVRGTSPTINTTEKTWSIALALEEGGNLFTVKITDLAGNSIEEVITVYRDTVFPVATVTSSGYVGDSSYTLVGVYTETGSGVASVIVDGSNAMINELTNTWSYNTNLFGGDNYFDIAITDNVGNRKTSNFYVTYDGAPPTRTDFYSLTKFSDGTGKFYVASMSTANPTSNPLYVTSDKISSGELLTVTDLDASDIPYIGMNVRDSILGTRNTLNGDIVVKTQYKLNGTVKRPWELLLPSPVSNDGSGYVMPITTESLHESWVSSSKNDIHRLEIELTDAVGNQQNYVHEFTVEFIAPEINVMIEDVDSFTESFANRINTFQNEKKVNTYTFTNPSEAYLYIKVSDASVHDASNLYDEAIRENRVNVKDVRQWQARLTSQGISNNYQMERSSCDRAVTSSWQNVTSVENWVDGDWRTISPEIIIGSTSIPVNTDTPLSDDPPSAWVNKPLPDNDFKRENARYGWLTLDRDLKVGLLYAYVNCGVASNSKILNWQERSTYSYVSAEGYPRNNSSTGVDKVLFSTTRFDVRDSNGNQIETINDGWYKVYPEVTIVISKFVTVPVLPTYNNVEVADLPLFSSYEPKRYDKVFSWNINREMRIIRVAGDKNEPTGLPISSFVGSESAIYTIAR